MRKQTYKGHYTPDYRKRKGEVFIEKSKKLYPDQIEYSKVHYWNTSTKVILTCKEHGDFECKPSIHLTRGKCCKECAKESYKKACGKTPEQSLEILKQVHGDTYEYKDLPEVINHLTLITIICKEHGEYKQSFSSHQQGRGCMICGYSRHSTDGFVNYRYFEKFPEKARKEGRLYLLQLFDELESFYKVGITSMKVRRRFSSMNEYQYKILLDLDMPVIEAYELEQLILEEVDDSYVPNKYFAGRSECFRSNNIKLFLEA
jgi:hypothetical protein